METQFNKNSFGLFVLLMLFTHTAFTQTKTVTGIVSSKDGEPLIGVNILIKNTDQGTVSEYDGSFTVEAAPSDTLQFSYIGFDPKEVPVSDNSYLEVQLESRSNLFDEVVVVGYGTMRKSDVTGSIISVRDEALTDVKSGNVFEALQGRVPGVDITRDNGRAGADIGILVRGERSLRATNAPLILVDGVPYGDNIDLPPEDIESIEILKDASSTAVYGSRGANGVILITTKRGVAGRSKIDFSVYRGFSEAFSKVPVFDREGYIQAKIDARKNIFDWDTEPNIQNAFLGDEVRGVEEGIETDWQDEVTKPGSQDSYYLGFSGGTDKMQYNTSLNYFREDGVVIQDEFQRYTFTLNLDAKLNELLKVGTSSVFSYRLREGNGPRFTDAVKSSPITEAYDSLGNYIFQPNFANPRKNPLAALDDIQEERSTRLFTTFYGELSFWDHFNFRTNFNADIGSGRLGFMYPQKVPTEGMTVSGVDRNDNIGYLWNNILSYNNTLGEQHRLSVTLVHEVQYDRTEFYGIDGQMQQFDRSLWYNLSTNQSPTTESNLQETALVSFLGRVNYTLADKYIFSLSGRFDGASQLSDDNKWDFFPAASVAWRIKDEPFLRNVNLISDLKLRMGYGATGNASIAPYSTAAALNSNPLFYEFGEPGGETPAFGFRPVALASVGLQWEKTQQVNLGLDFGLFNNRVSGSIDLFRAETDRLLLQDQLPPTAGFDNVFVNAGKTRSWGVEVYLQSFNVNTKNFKWNSVVSFSSSREEILELTSGLTEDEGNLWFVGQPISVIYDFQKTGIWQFGEEDQPNFTAPGEIKVADVNGDGIINFDDRMVLGTPRPDWVGSFINTFNIFGFDLTINIYARMGQLVDASAYDFDPRMLDNQLDINYWTPVNPTNDYPRLDASRAELPFESTLSYRDGSFIKVKNITLGYSLPESLLGKTPLSKARLYASGRNPYIIYSAMVDGLDPERNGSTSWPLSRLWLIGMDITF